MPSKPSAAKIFRNLFSPAAIAATYASSVAGPRAIGLDRMDGRQFESRLADEVDLISRKVLAGTYRFTKYKERLISKGADKPPRQLSLPTIRDRLTLRVLCDLLFAIFPEAKPSLPQTKIEILKSALDSGAYTHFIKIDLKDFYPSINHPGLLSRLHRRIRVGAFRPLVQRALQTPTVPENSTKAGTERLRGVPQGLSISNVLAEIYMLGVDQMISSVAPFYTRFVDDIVVLTSADPTPLANQILLLLKKEKLNPHPIGAPGSKSRTGEIGEGLEFLGYSLTPGQVSVRETSLHAFERALVGVFTEYKHRHRNAKSPTERDFALSRFRWALNLKLTGCIFRNQRFGWIFYYSQITDLTVLRRIDHTVGRLFARFEIPTPPHPKRLHKAYYESKRVDKSTHVYIPNYDEIGVKDMRKLLKSIGYSVDGFPDSEVQIAFQKLVRRVTRDLERDIAHLS